MFRRLLPDRWEKLIDPFACHDNRTPPADVWRFLALALRPLRGVMAMSLALNAVGAAIEVWLIFYAGRLVDTLAAGAPGQVLSEHGVELLAVTALVLIARPLLSLLREGLDDIAFRPNAEAMVRWRAHQHVLGQSVGWFRNDMAGRIAAWVREAGTSAATAAYVVVHTLSFVIVYIAGSIWLMASIDPRLALLLVAWLGLYFVLMAYVVPHYRRASAHLQEANSALTGLLVDTYANIDTIKLFSSRQEEAREGRATFGTALFAYFGVQRVEVTMNAGMTFLGSLLMVALIGQAIMLWQSGMAPIGLIAAALALSFRITSMAEWVLDAMSSLFGSIGALRQALKTIAQPVDIADAPGARALAVRGGAIDIKGVSHHYGKGDGGLDRLSLSIAAGEKVGLVGRSGAGKSTLVNLILRFFEPEAGTIEIDGQDIGSVTQESLRRHVSMVAQDAALLHRSVRENIAYGRPDTSESAIAAAVRRAAADRFIPGLRDQEGRTGYDAHVGERGVKLSGGQRQRIVLARAILKDAPILVLDEATSALDSEVEAAIQDTLHEVMDGKTVIAIAHRLSTLAQMDRIVVLDEGRVVEDGRHEELLAQGGIYAELWALQANGFIGIAAAG